MAEGSDTALWTAGRAQDMPMAARCQGGTERCFKHEFWGVGPIDLKALAAFACMLLAESQRRLARNGLLQAKFG